MKETYLKHGYRIIEVSRDTVEKRRNYAIEVIEINKTSIRKCRICIEEKL
jgi:hypothetical protein